MLSLVISDIGANPLVAYNGQECVDIVKNQHVDMILMDYNMPVMDGIEATKIVRSLPQGEDIVIIGITVYDDDNDVKSSIDAGMDMLFPKLELNDEKLLEIGMKYFADKNGDIPLDGTTNGRSSPCENTDVISSDLNSIENTVMDYDEALSEFDNNDDILIPLMVEFNKIIQDKLTIMRTALTNADYELLQREAHGIKGGASNLCARPLSNAAKLLEKACRQGSEVTVIEDLLNEFAERIQEFGSYVKSTLNKNENIQLS